VPSILVRLPVGILMVRFDVAIESHLDRSAVCRSIGKAVVKDFDVGNV